MYSPEDGTSVKIVFGLIVSMDLEDAKVTLLNNYPDLFYANPQDKSLEKG